MHHLKRSGGLLLLVLLVAAGLGGSAEAKKPWEKIAIPQLGEIKMPAYERVELSNGMVVYLAEDHEFPLIELSATIEVGSIYEPADLVGLAQMTGTVMRSGGTTSRNGDDIDELVESRGLAVETWIGQNSGGAYVSALVEDTDLGLELLADILRNPAFPEAKIKLAKEEQKAGDQPPQRRPHDHRPARGHEGRLRRRTIRWPATPSTTRSRRSPARTCRPSTRPGSTPTACTWS